MTQLIINKEAKVNAQGKVNHKNAKPVFCMNTGHIYASVIDAAECTSSDAGDISRCCNGKIRHVKGNRYCFVKDVPANLDEISNNMSKYSDIIAERELKEKKRLENEKHKETLAKLKEKYAKETEKLDTDKIKIDKLNDKVHKREVKVNVLYAKIQSLESMLM